MRADGPDGVALCRSCFRQYLAIWRAEDAELERAELAAADHYGAAAEGALRDTTTTEEEHDDHRDAAA